MRTLVLSVLFALCTSSLGMAASNGYVGSAACKDCHEGEYSRFMKYSKKAHSQKGIETMASKLTPQELQSCYECHTTGHGKGGFVDYKTTPHLGDVGCETCHGPGAAHVETGDVKNIAKPSMDTCQTCHNESRVKSFGFKPLVHSGAH